jgi:hypothetical protein
LQGFTVADLRGPNGVKIDWEKQLCWRYFADQHPRRVKKGLNFSHFAIDAVLERF